MALETLENINEIDGYEVCHLDKRISKEEFEKVKKYITINHEENTITFKIQKGPVKENGKNGCQIDTIIDTARYIVLGLNKTHPCKENLHVLTNLSIANTWLHIRKIEREIRGVEGTNNN